MGRNICEGGHFVATVEVRAEIEGVNLKSVLALAVEHLPGVACCLASGLEVAFHNAEVVLVHPSFRLYSVHRDPFAVDSDRAGALDAALVREARVAVPRHADDVDIFVDGDASVSDVLACVGERALDAWVDDRTLDVVGDDELLACHPCRLRAGACVGVADAFQAVAETWAEECPYLHLDDILLATACPVVHDHCCHC